MPRSAAHRARAALAILALGGCSLEGLTSGVGPDGGGAGQGGSAGFDASGGAGGAGGTPDAAGDVTPQPSNEIWARRFGSVSPEQEGTALGIDGSCAVGPCVVVGGYFTESADFGGGALETTTTAGDTDLFIARLEADSAHRWSRDYGDQREQRVRDLAIDATGDTVVAGFFKGVLEFGADQPEPEPAWKNDAFLAKISIDGNPVWIRTWGGSSAGVDDNHQQADSVAVDPSENIFVAGTFAGSITLDKQYDATDGQDIWVAKLAPNGSLLWGKAWDGHTGNSALYAAVGPDGDLYLTGNFSGTLDLGCSTVLDTNSTSDDAFVARFDGAGACKWARQFGNSSSTQMGRGLALVGDDLVVVFEIAGDIDFGFGALKGVGRDVVVARLAGSDGAPVWAIRASDPGDQLPTDVAADSDGASVIVGTFAQSLTLSDGQTSSTLISNGENDVFVARLNGDGTLDWAQRFGDIANDAARSVAIDETGAIVVTGRFRGDVDFGKTMLSSASGEGDIFVAKFSRAAPK